MPKNTANEVYKVLRINVTYWKVLKDEYGLENGFPSFFGVGFKPNDQGHYGSPSIEYPQHIKVCSHEGDVVDADTRDKAPLRTDDTEGAAEFVTNFLPGVEPTPSLTECCIYTMTPDEDFCMDYHPLHKNIVIGAGFSGHGFKLAPVVGNILRGLALHEEATRYDLTPFQIQRFGSSVLSAKSKI